ncbi:hypothetical protein V6N13_053430 [Hibiscus sabdariffa]
MDFSPFLVPFLLPLRSPNSFSQNPVRNLFVSLLGCFVVPSKNDVGLFLGGLARNGCDGWWQRCGGRLSEGSALQTPWRVMGSSLLLGFRHCSNAKGRLRASPRGSLPQIQAYGSWVHVRGNLGGVKAKSWNPVGAWLEEGGGFKAVMIKNRESLRTWSNPTMVSCKTGKELASVCRTGKVPMERAFRYFQATWLPLHVSNSVSKLTHGWWTEISGILSPIILFVCDLIWFSLEIAEIWSNIFVGTIFWLNVIVFYSWESFTVCCVEPNVKAIFDFGAHRKIRYGK